MSSPDELQLFLSPYPGELREKILWARSLIQEKFPAIMEVIDHPAKLVAYTYGNGYKDMLCVLIPSLKDAKISFSKGAELSSEFPQLQGDGKKTRYLSLLESSFDEHLIDRLLDAAQLLHESTKQG